MSKIRIGLFLALALSVSGCAAEIEKFKTAYTVITSASVSPQLVYVAANTFDGLERSATNYLNLPRCPKASICRDPNATKAIIPAINSGRAARNQLKAFLRSHPGQLGPQGLYDALQASISTLSDVISQYNIPRS